jgi:hypothetical protein
MRHGRRSLRCVVAVAVACAVAVTAGCGGGSSKSGETAGTSTEQTGTSTELTQDDVMNRAEGHGESFTLAAGRHHVKALDPSFSFALTKTTPADGMPSRLVGLTLAGDGGSPEVQLSFWTRSFDLLDPAVEHSSLSELKADEGAPKTADGVLQWLMAHPRLITSGVKDVTIGGVAGIEVGVAVKDGRAYEAGDFCTASCAPILFTPPLAVPHDNGNWIVDAPAVGERIRIQLLDVHGKLLMLLTEVAGGDYAQNAGPADKVISTLKFE